MEFSTLYENFSLEIVFFQLDKKKLTMEFIYVKTILLLSSYDENIWVHYFLITYVL